MKILKIPVFVLINGPLGAHCGGKNVRVGGYLRRFGAHTRARFLACMLVLLLKEAM